MKGGPTGSPMTKGLAFTPRRNTMTTSKMAASRRAPQSWMTLPLYEAHALEPDQHGEQQRDIEGGLGEVVAPACKGRRR